jgi:hypothetical protein
MMPPAATTTATTSTRSGVRITTCGPCRAAGFTRRAFRARRRLIIVALFPIVIHLLAGGDDDGFARGDFRGPDRCRGGVDVDLHDLHLHGDHDVRGVTVVVVIALITGVMLIVRVLAVALGVVVRMIVVLMAIVVMPVLVLPIVVMVAVVMIAVAVIVVAMIVDDHRKRGFRRELRHVGAARLRRFAG